jgi:multiple sugar transport system ATP-binding protein
MLAGLEEVSKGEVWIGDRMVNNVHPKDRDIAMVFQSYALYPHMTVYDNIAFGLKIRKIPDQDIRGRVDNAAEILGLSELLERKPKALSGGQRQRVALGRAIVRNPSVFLFDEPLSNLDAELRVQMRAQISQLQHKLSTTTIYVTHDQVEAMTMGQRIAVLRPWGESEAFGTNLMQCGTPLELYDYPRNLFTARFIGTPRMNVVDATISEDGLQIEASGITVPVNEEFKQIVKDHRGQAVLLGIRPEHLGSSDEVDWESAAQVKGRVEFVEPLGHEVILHLEIGGNILLGRLRSHHNLPAIGDEVDMAVKADTIHLFDKRSEHRLE